MKTIIHKGAIYKEADKPGFPSTLKHKKCGTGLHWNEKHKKCMEIPKNFARPEINQLTKNALHFTHTAKNLKEHQRAWDAHGEAYENHDALANSLHKTGFKGLGKRHSNLAKFHKRMMKHHGHITGGYVGLQWESQPPRHHYS